MSVIVFNQNPCKIFLIAHNFSAAVEASLAINFSYKTNNEEWSPKIKSHRVVWSVDLVLTTCLFPKIPQLQFHNQTDFKTVKRWYLLVVAPWRLIQSRYDFLISKVHEVFSQKLDLELGISYMITIRKISELKKCVFFSAVLFVYPLLDKKLAIRIQQWDLLYYGLLISFWQLDMPFIKHARNWTIFKST